ncbi:hypothetical protein [Pseudomonas tructae]|uniref:hypothetical protein n=1 Tax=Pseudomonas tructae TaxID=2518644 RepID=UPI0015AF6472|nr:hypothetical protein [Pseudomonas tructae]
MKKPVPDPPRFTFTRTAETSVHSCPDHPPLLCVLGGVSAEDALVHALMYLKAATATFSQIVEHTEASGRGHAWATQHSLEVAMALVEAVLDGSESGGKQRRVERHVLSNMPVSESTHTTVLTAWFVR